MTTSTVASFDQQDAAAAKYFLLDRYRLDERWTNAIARAWDDLIFVRWQWDGSTLYIASGTDTTKRYTVTAAGCECEAAMFGVICSHMAARHIVVYAIKFSPTF